MTTRLEKNLTGCFRSFIEIFRKRLAENRPESQSCFQIADRQIRIFFSQPAFAQALAPAFDHLSQDKKENIDLEIFVWDNDDDEFTAFTSVLKDPKQFRNHHGYYGFFNESLHLYYAYFDGIKSCSLYDEETNQAGFWIEDAANIPYYEKACPFRFIFQWWLRRNGGQLIHAGAVGNQQGGVLITGRDGAGKSSTCLSCLENGMLYASDDYTALSLNPLPRAHSLYNSLKLDEHGLNRFAHWKKRFEEQSMRGPDKAAIFLHRYFPEKIVSGFPITAIVLPRVSDLRISKLSRVSPAESLRRLAPGTLFQMRVANQNDFQFLKELVNRLPSYCLDLGTDTASVREAVAGLLR